MARDVRLDLLLKEIKDEYVQENFRKLKRYIDCLEQKIAEGSGGGGGNTIIIGNPTTFYKSDIVVDAPFIISRDITLSVAPKANSDRVYLNGLILPDDCYAIAGTTLTIDGSLDIEVGDDIFVRYAS